MITDDGDKRLARSSWRAIELYRLTSRRVAHTIHAHLLIHPWAFMHAINRLL